MLMRVKVRPCYISNGNIAITASALPVQSETPCSNRRPRMNRDSFLQRWLLFPFSIVFGLLVACKNLLYQTGVLNSIRFSIPVIGVLLTSSTSCVSCVNIFMLP
jgi:hypothetical protein